jgi:hypothetical protein
VDIYRYAQSQPDRDGLLCRQNPIEFVTLELEVVPVPLLSMLDSETCRELKLDRTDRRAKPEYCQTHF